MDAAGHSLVENTMDRLGLSARAYNRVLQIARSIADVDPTSGVHTKGVCRNRPETAGVIRVPRFRMH